MKTKKKNGSKEDIDKYTQHKKVKIFVLVLFTASSTCFSLPLDGIRNSEQKMVVLIVIFKLSNTKLNY